MMRIFTLGLFAIALAACGGRSDLLVDGASDSGKGGATTGSGSVGGFASTTTTSTASSSSIGGAHPSSTSSSSPNTTSSASGGDGGSGVGGAGGAGGAGGVGGAGGCGGACNCPSGTHACGDVCADDLSNQTCGTRCSPCPTPPNSNGITTCDGSGCHFGCEPGFTNCNGGCLQGFETDPTNCGYCGHDCLGGACIAGSCQPVVLLSGEPLVRFIAVDADSLYFTTGQSGGTSIEKIPLAGGAVQTVVSGIAPNGLAVDDTYLYFADGGSSGSVKRIDKHGGTPTTLTSNVPGAFGVAIGGPTLCFSQIYIAKLSCMPIGGGTPTLLDTLDPEGGATGVAMDAANLYFGTYGSVGAYPFAGGAPTTIAAQQNDAIAVAVDDYYVYWSTLYGGNVDRVSKLGGQPTTILSNLGYYGGGIALDAKALYFASSATNNISTIVRIAK